MADRRAIAVRPRPTLITMIVIGTMAIGPFINYVFSALAPVLIRRTDLSSGDLGIIVTVIFGVATVGSARAGAIVDHRGSVWSSKLLLLSAAAALITIVVANILAVFIVGALLAGVAHALSHPTTNALVSSHIPSNRQGLVVGLKQSGVQVGQLFAGLLLPVIAPIIGWRLAVLTGLVIILLAWLGLHNVESPPTAGSERMAEVERAPVRSAMWLAVYALVLGVASQGTNVYLSLFAFEELGFTESAAGLMVGVVGATGVVARIGWGVWVHRFSTMWKPLLAIAALMLASVFFFWLAMPLGSGYFVVGVALLSISATAVSVLLSLALIQAPTKEGIGVNSGVVMRGLYAGYMVGPFLFGQIIEAAGYAPAWGVMAVFALAAAVTAGTAIRRRAL